jgi:hypothetical protein
MKLPRWLVIAMLTTSVLSVLAAAGWWWVTWPERTAAAFVHFIADRRFESAKEMISSAWVDEENSMQTLELLAPLASQTTLDAHSRSYSDVFCARQEFQVLGIACILVAERGSVVRLDCIWDAEVLQAVSDYLKTAGPGVTMQDVAQAVQRRIRDTPTKRRVRVSDGPASESLRKDDDFDRGNDCVK